MNVVYNILADLILSLEVETDKGLVKPFKEVIMFKNQLYNGDMKLSRDTVYIKVGKRNSLLIKSNREMLYDNVEGEFLNFDWSVDVDFIFYVGQPNNYTLYGHGKNDSTIKDLADSVNLTQLIQTEISDITNIDDDYFDSSVRFNKIYLRSIEDFDYTEGDGSFQMFKYNIEFKERILKNKIYKFTLTDYDITCTDDSIA